MFGLSLRRQNADTEARAAAIDRAMAVIEFELDGTIRTANQNFLRVMGYGLDEIRGRHHSIFVDAEHRDSDGYRRLWERLAKGEYVSDRFSRVAKGGRVIWIQGSYNPMLDGAGRPYRVVKFATDISEQIERANDTCGKLMAIDRAMAVIEFKLDGTILAANQNFLDAMGYTLPEIQGRHHSMFVDAAERESAGYRQFWASLAQGSYQAARYRRIGRDGKEVWIQACYNPILSISGKPYKVVKFATDISENIRLVGEVRRLLDVNLGEIALAVGDAGVQSGAAAQAADETSGTVQTVASAAEEMTASIREIADNMTRSGEAVNNVTAQARLANESTARLAEFTRSMSGVVSLIQGIASQINLLALNATIESARAGDAGKGFAVVAGEVKNLARQAADATEQISREIDGVQHISNDVVTALDRIADAVGSVKEHITTTASAVEQQSAVTREMSSSMQKAAAEISSITSNLARISDAATQAGTAMDRTREAAKSLAR